MQWKILLSSQPKKKSWNLNVLTDHSVRKQSCWIINVQTMRHFFSWESKHLKKLAKHFMKKFSFWFFQESCNSASFQLLLLFQITADVKKLFKPLLNYVQEIFQTASILCSRKFLNSFKSFTILFTLCFPSWSPFLHSSSLTKFRGNDEVPFFMYQCFFALFPSLNFGWFLTGFP